MPGWKKSTEGITEFGKLPKKAQEYLRFIERESGAAIGMISTGPDRNQTIFMPEFQSEMLAARTAVKSARAK
jgi:adenylosuccinate synthase